MVNAQIEVSVTKHVVLVAPEEGPAVELSVLAPPLVLIQQQGLQGPMGPSAAVYEHEQVSASALWAVPHNLGFRPSVSVWTVGGLEVIADVQHLSENTLTITFQSAMAGTARLN